MRHQPDPTEQTMPQLRHFHKGLQKDERINKIKAAKKDKNKKSCTFVYLI